MLHTRNVFLRDFNKCHVDIELGCACTLRSTRASSQSVQPLVSRLAVLNACRSQQIPHQMHYDTDADNTNLNYRGT